MDEEWQDAAEFSRPPVCVECETALRDANYWRKNYEILRRVIAAQHEDPALAWLDEIVKTRFAKL